MNLLDNPLKWLREVDPKDVNIADLRDLETLFREQRQAYDDLWEAYLRVTDQPPS